MYYAHLVKKASEEEHDLSDYRQLETIMERVYNEAPWKWPHGLNIKGHTESFIVKRAQDDEPVGFVGWQEREEGHRKIGYYSVGILPEFRGKRFATEAVSSLLTKKASEVDVVKALIVEGNKASERLANKLEVEVSMTKLASGKVEAAVKTGSKLKEFLTHGGIGVGLAGLMDAAILKDKGAIGLAMGNKEADPWALPDTLFNAITLGGGGKLLTLPGAGPKVVGAFTAAAAPLTTLGSAAIRKWDDTNTATAELADAQKRQNALVSDIKSTGQEGAKKLMESGGKFALGAGLIGTGLVGAGILQALAKRRHAKATETAALVDAATNAQGRMRVTLPTKNPGDAETHVEMPMNQVGLSDALASKLSRDFRRRLYAETRERTKRKNPKDKDKPTEDELNTLKVLEEEQDLTKEASMKEPMEEKEVSPEDAYAQQLTAEAKILQAENALKKQQIEASQIDRQAMSVEAVRKAKKMALAKKQIEGLAVMKKKANYDPNIGKEKGVNLPKGAPASMAYSTITPYSVHNQPAEGAEVPESTDPGDLNKKIEKLEKENIDLKIKEEARRIAEKTIGKSSSAVGDGLQEKLKNIKMALGGIKSGSAYNESTYKNPSAPLVKGKLINTSQLDQAIVESARRTAPGGAGDGIQVPIRHRSMMFGPGVHQFATQMRRGFAPIRPTSAAYLASEQQQAPTVGWPERIMGLVSSFLPQQQPQYNPYGQ